MEWNPPDTCANGHPLEYPTALVGWSPCQCSRATGRPSGHRYVLCRTCRWEWREDGCDKLDYPATP